MREPLTPQEELLLRKELARASAQGWGVALGALCGLGLFAATLWLVIKGGENPGPHLQLLSVYFPGYRVTVVGSAIGFVYAFVAGYAIGRTIAVIYNRLLP
jgi:hypothetical protein